MSQVIQETTRGVAINLQPINAAAVTKSDATVFAASTLYVGGAGDVAVTTVGGDTVTFSAMAAGTILPVLVTQVKAATTATLIIRLY
jgi:hypothetical protein